MGRPHAVGEAALKLGTRAPWAIWPERSTAITASSSSRPRIGFTTGIMSASLSRRPVAQFGHGLIGQQGGQAAADAMAVAAAMYRHFDAIRRLLDDYLVAGMAVEAETAAAGAHEAD